jgi:LytS/YehU family sensor histidine kinase
MTVDLEIAPDTRSCLVPFLILQPLVENAVRHGISRLSRPGRILIRSRRNRERLEFEIRNDGPADAPRTPSEGLGLGNTRDRLKALYGDDFDFGYGAMPEGGWRVGIKIPCAGDEESGTPDA